MMDTRESSIGQPRLKIGLDIDGTLAYSHETIIELYNSMNNSSFSKSDILGWGDVNFITTDEFDALHHISWKENWRSIRPSISQESLEELSRFCNIEILTGMPNKLRESLESWLELHFPKMRFSIRHADLVEKPFLGYDILFDDANPVADSFIRNGNSSDRLYLMEEPWNKDMGYGLRDSRITVVKDLDHGIRHLLSKDGI